MVVDDAVDHGCLPECVKILRDDVSGKQSQVLGYTILADRPARVEHKNM